MKTNKYLYLYVVQGYYTKSYGWEDITQSENYIEARNDIRAYRENERGYMFRMIHRRELNPEWESVPDYIGVVEL
jgi:hypothetical protein